jgi:hypothetical protein
VAVPAEPAAPPLAPHRADLEALDRALTLLRRQVEVLRDRRRADTRLTDGWQGGHRDRYADALADCERLGRRIDDALARLALAGRRALDAGER